MNNPNTPHINDVRSESGHNSTEDNLRFAIQFSETNLRYLAGETPRNMGLIAETKAKIASLNQELEALTKTK